MTRPTSRRYAPAALVVIGLVVLAVAVAMWRLSPGPAVPLWAGSDTCYLSNITGELVADPISGVAIIERHTGNPDRTTRLDWPGGYTARLSGSEVEVLDRRGVVVARTGTRMEIQGGYGLPRGFEVCAGLTKLDGSPWMKVLP